MKKNLRTVMDALPARDPVRAKPARPISKAQRKSDLAEARRAISGVGGYRAIHRSGAKKYDV